MRIDALATSAAVATRLRHIVARDLRARGAVVAMSGAVDGSVCAALAARALGPERVPGLVLPERDSAARDTAGAYTLPLTQDEFHFTLPLEQMDCVMYGLNHGMSPERVAQDIDLPVAEVERAYHEVGEIPEIH